jgi:hypothetical protein
MVAPLATGLAVVSVGRVHDLFHPLPTHPDDGANLGQGEPRAVRGDDRSPQRAPRLGKLGLGVVNTPDGRLESLTRVHERILLRPADGRTSYNPV